MDPSTLAQFIAFVAAVAPALEQAIVALVKDFEAQHPSLTDPPPADGEAAVDAQADKDLAKNYD